MKIELIVLVVLSAIVSMFTLSSIIGGVSGAMMDKVMLDKCGDMVLYEAHLEVIVPAKCLELFGESREEVEKIKRRKG